MSYTTKSMSLKSVAQVTQKLRKIINIKFLNKIFEIWFELKKKKFKPKLISRPS